MEPSVGAQLERWVIVGAGSSGCVLAGRLSQDPDRDVTLLESGPDLSSADVPATVVGPDFLAALDEPGRTFAALTATRVDGGPPSPYRRGTGIGGSSVVNAMVALRGDPDLYRSWGWDDAPAAWAAIDLPAEVVTDAELGIVDRALLAAAPDAHPATLTRRHGRRVTSAEASLWPVLGRDNLHVVTDAMVDRVLFDGRRAVGVLLADGRDIAADRIVLAAGAIHSPAILLRSGVDTPGVGCNLQDHPSVPLTLALRPEAVTGSSGLVIGSLLTRGDIQYLPMNHLGRGAPGFGLLMTALMRPRGRSGSVRLASPDATVDPLVDFALLDNEHDVSALVAGVEGALDLVRTPPFRAVVREVFIDSVGTTAAGLVDRAAIERWVMSAAGDYVHASSSCAMGTVVDDEGTVRGYQRLHVCDASVFPTIPDVNTHLPTTMLAERLSARWRRHAPLAG